MGYYNTYIENPLVKENTFLLLEAENIDLPAFEEVKAVLPQPFWENHEPFINCYWKAWRAAFKNLRKATKENNFITNYIDSAFVNGNLFMWDSVFCLFYGRYGCRAFNFLRTLDNFYAKQHPDGFICRELSGRDSSDLFHRFDPASTGPNIMAWSEWEYFRIFRDKERLKKVFPVLLAFHRWFKAYRTWPDGSYWACGWACGMDNQPRIYPKEARPFYHGHYVWIDTCMQQIFNAKLLINISEIVNRRNEVDDLYQEVKYLTEYVNRYAWDDKTSFYYDLDGRRNKSNVKTIGAYWALLAEVVPKDRVEKFVEHLEDPKEFKRPHRIPTLSADHPEYEADGGYWLGGVWPNTNYMVLKGLEKIGYYKLAHEIALNHLQNVVSVYEETDKLWENYAPESISKGNPALPDYVGWSGLGPIAVLFENIFGIKIDVPNKKITWDIRILEEHGVKQLPFDGETIVNLTCKRRTSFLEEPIIKIEANMPLDLEIHWDGGSKIIEVK